jgi:hypothetical protein
MAGKLFPISTLPGIKRDGTRFASRHYIDGQWCRFQRGVPRKMGGYKQIVGNLPNIPRGVFLVPQTLSFNLYIADQNGMSVIQIDQFGNTISDLVDITPNGFTADPNNVWTFDVMYSNENQGSTLIAHCAPNLYSISSEVETPVYYGDTSSLDPLEALPIQTSGGIVVLHPYLFIYGNDGLIQWSLDGQPDNILGNNYNRAAAQKIVAGMPVRGGNSSPAGLFWSLDSVIRVTFNPNPDGSPGFRFDTISNQNSILSSRSIVEYDGLYFWAGTDRFLFYNGVIQEVPNIMNQNYFFYNNGTTGLNYSQRQKVWATKVPQYGEIWWPYPSGISTECDRTVIFNKRENTWYDTAFEVDDNFNPVNGRGAGYFEQVFSDPLWADNNPNGGPYSIWMHESGIDKNIGGALTAIPSFYETGDVAWCGVGPEGQWTGADRWIDIERLEPDFLLTGSMTFQVKGKEFANSEIVGSELFPFDSTTEKIDLREQRRQMTLRFTSNEVGGFYELGQTLLYFTVGDARA